MSRATPEETCMFLIKCIKYSNNGKVDFAAVADEMGIVSRGAAAKRYERILKGYSCQTSSSEGGEEDSTPGTPLQTPKKGGTPSKPKTPRKTPAKSKAGASKTPTKRKSKGEASSTPTKLLKSEEKVIDSDESCKADDEAAAELAASLLTSNDPFLPQATLDSAEDEAMFKEFCNTSAAIQAENGVEMQTDII